MIVLDHNALGSPKPDKYERDYLVFYLSNTNEKAIVPNEVWESFRKKVIAKNKPEIAEEIIAVYRSIVKPETMIFNDDYSEKEPENDYTGQELIGFTEDLIKRFQSRIKYFICGKKTDYTDTSLVYTLDVEEFYVHCMGEFGLVDEYHRLMGRKDKSQ